MITHKLYLCTIVVLIALCGCMVGSVTPSSNVESAEQSSTRESVTEVNSSDVLTQQELLLILTKRAIELGEDIPVKYLETVSQHTQITNPDNLDIAKRRDSYDDYLEQFLFPNLGIFVKESGSHYVILMRQPIQIYHNPQYHEYHVFRNGEYLGMRTHRYPSREEELTLYENEGYAWLSEVVLERSGMGNGQWLYSGCLFDLNGSLLTEVLRFPSYSSSYFHSADTDLHTEIADIHITGNGEATLNLAWKETITYNDTAVIYGEGTIFYSNSESHATDSRFTAEPGYRGSSYPASAFGKEPYRSNNSHNMRVLLCYMEPIVEIAEHGDTEQQEWLVRFLDSVQNEVALLEQLNQWYTSKKLQ